MRKCIHWRSALNGLWPWLLWMGGMVASLGPMLVTGLGRVSASRGDPRLIHYALEHSWRWVIRHPLHLSFYDLPIYYPYGDVAAFTDVLLGAGPLYWPWRALGIEPVTAFQLWEAAAWSSGFLCAYLLLRRSLGFGTAAAAVGAYLFAFGNFRLANQVHPQLLPQYAVLLGVAAVAGFFRPGQSPARRRLWIGALTLAVALQMWTALNTERPTVNGRYGNTPPGYYLTHARAVSREENRRLRQALDFWLHDQRIESDTVCWVTQPGFPIKKAGLTRWP